MLENNCRAHYKSKIFRRTLNYFAAVTFGKTNGYLENKDKSNSVFCYMSTSKFSNLH